MGCAHPKLPAIEDPISWAPADVTVWLQSIGLPKYAKLFAQFSIDGKQLLEMPEDQLSLFVAPKYASKLATAIAKLRTNQSLNIIRSINAQNYDKLTELLRPRERSGSRARLTKVINPPLVWAALKGEEDVVQLLIHEGCDVDYRNEHGDCALHWAAQEGHVNIVQKLLWCGAKVNVVSNTGDTPLIAAAWKNHEAVVQLLLMYGADPSIQNIERKSAVHYTTDQKVLKLLTGPRNGPPPLMYLCLQTVRSNKSHPACKLAPNKLPIDLEDRLGDLLPE